MTYRDDVVAMCADAPNAQALRAANGEATRGPIEWTQRLSRDAIGETVESLERVASIPAHHLPSVVRESVVTVTDPETEVETSFRVHDRSPQVGDGLVDELWLVEA